jgi:hypothetical protein
MKEKATGLQTQMKEKATGLQTQMKEKTGELQKRIGNKKVQIQQQRKDFGDATALYKERTKEIMPNKVNYSCYKIMSMGFCHVVYMGVSYATVLRIPVGGIKIVKKKEPTENYTLYNYNNRMLSINENMSSECKYSNKNNNSGNGNEKGKENIFGNQQSTNNKANTPNKTENLSETSSQPSPIKDVGGMFACSIL